MSGAGDRWGRGPSGNNKRSFMDMSRPQRTPLSFSASPSPSNSPGPYVQPAVSRQTSATRPSAAPTAPSRRILHPHNRSPHSSHRGGSATMPSTGRAHSRPRPEPASQTIIDLTEDAEEDPVVNRRRSRNQHSQTPRLERSDGRRLAQVIDLTEDPAEGEDEIQVMAERQLPIPRPHPNHPFFNLNLGAPPGRPRSPDFAFLDPNPAPNPHPAHRFRDFLGVQLGALPQFFFGGNARDMDNFEALVNLGVHGVDAAQAQAMPGRLNYEQAAFAENKPEHVAPPPAEEGFTRSPTEDDVLICPSCEEELVHHPNGDALGSIKKTGKNAQKDREEHPFWVVKDCGHVFCNKCYQNRVLTKTSKPTGFRVVQKQSSRSTKSTTTMACAVDNCDSDVKSKDKWVGVFL